MTVITLDNIGNPKHRSVLRYISDVFDENRGKIEDHIALTKFNSANHTILFNTESPDLNGKTLIPFDSDKLLFAPIKINSIICSDPKNNTTINSIIQPNNSHTWEAVSDENKFKLFLRLNGKNTVAGFSVRFADSVRTKYRVGISLGNDNGEVLSEMIEGIDSSWDTNNHQFFQFSSPVEGVTKAVMTVELPGTNKDFTWKINNISLYSNMNLQSMKGLSESGIITWSLIHNPTVRRDMEPEPNNNNISNKTPEPLLKTKSIQEPPEITAHTDYAGSPLLHAPDLDRQFFDNLSPEEITKLSNLPRLYTVTDLPTAATGSKLYTFQTKEGERTLTLKFQPLQEMAKYPDETITDLDKLVQTGAMKKGGFKNYILTMYLKLDNVNQTTNQLLLWKYGGFFFSRAQPQMARASNITIPINNKNNDDVPHVYSEYFFEKLDDRTDKLMMNADISDFKGIEPGKWIGIQFIRNIDTQNKKSVQIVRINRNPMDDNGNLTNPYDFENYLVYVDEASEQKLPDGSDITQEHIPHIWGGVAEVISIVGAEFVSLYGISLYEYVKEE